MCVHLISGGERHGIERTASSSNLKKVGSFDRIRLLWSFKSVCERVSEDLKTFV